MTINPFGPGVSRYIDGRDKQLAGVVYEYNRPPLDSELNLMQLVELEARAEQLRALMPSGWLMNESSPRSDFFTSPSYSNLFFFGRNTPGEVRNLSWAVVNGWMIPVSGTKTGAPPLAANDQDTWNKILLSPPSTSTGGNRAEFAFLEVWLARIDTDPAPPTVAPGKPQRGFVYRFGNVESGFSYIPDDIIDPDLNYESTKRVQVQYRIRVVPDVNVAQYPEGFDPTLVFAQGMLAAPSSLSFQNMRQALGDPGLWRSGTGDPATFGTADGFVYAIPLCSVFRRNSAGFSDIGNMAGAFSRNSKANLRTDATVYTASVALSADMGLTDTSFSLSSIAGTVLATMNSFGEAYFRIDDEIVRVNNVVGVTPTLFTMTVDRGQLQSIVRAHKAGSAVVPYTVRPDGLFADQVSLSDILDMRHSVADKFDYDSILKTSLTELMKGNLRTSWKRFGSTNSAGPVVFYGDRVTDSSVFVGGLSRLDAPDGNRRTFSDAATVQRFNVPVRVPSNSAIVGDPVQVVVEPYVVAASWAASPPVHVSGNRLSGGLYPSWWNGDQVRISISTFRAGLPGSDADQVRFVLPSEDPDAVIVRFEGMTTDPNGGNPPASPPTTTSPSATDPTLVTAPLGNRIMKSGQGLTVTVDVSGNLVITLASGATDTELQEFRDALQGNTSTPYVQRVSMHVEFAVVYGTGRGLSHRPDFVHTVQYRGTPTNAARTMLRGGLSDKNRMIPTYFGDSPYVQTGNNRNLARTSEVMVDPGSKTVHIAPYRNVLPPSPMVRSGTQLNWWYNPAIQYQGAMPLLSQDGAVSVHPVVDPLDMFYNAAETRYVEVPMEYLPRPGLHHVPILPNSGTVFSSGINFLLMSKEGPVADTSDYNRAIVSYPNTYPGWYVATPTVGEVYGQASGSWSVFGQKYSNAAVRAGSGGPLRGIKFPPFLAPARITGVYQRALPAVVPASSPFNTDRVYVGGAGTSTNLLRDSFDGPTFLLDVDLNGDAYFVLNAEVLDLSRISSSATFDNTEFLVECTMFGFDRGFLQTNGRILVAKSSGGGTVPVATDAFLTASDNAVGLVAPAPLATGASNNEVTMYYSRTPYQGDAFGTQSAHSDDVQRLGPLTVGEANALRSSPLGPVSTLALPNRNGFEVLASTSFVTSLGTGRLSGSPPIPLLNTTEAPANPPDYSGTVVDLRRRFSANRVGYDDWSATKFPVAPGSFAARPAVKLGALSEVYDNEAPPEFAGCTVHLPLGSYFRDKDFVGKTLYHQKNSVGVGAVPIGSMAVLNYEAPQAPQAPGSSTWEGTEFVCGSSSGTTGVGSESLIRVDGTSNPSSTTVFKTTRGGAAWSATGPWPGGAVSSRFPKARPNADIGSVLVGNAYLVRSQPESVGLSEYHMGSELQMVIVTQAVPAYFKDTDVLHSASGTNEGFTAADRYRVPGRPLEKRRGFVNTSVLPSDRPLFVNSIFDNPLLYGSSDVSLMSLKQEIIPVTVDGQTTLSLSVRPLDPTTVQLFLNGIKLAYGVNYTVGGVTNQTITYIPSVSNPSLLTTDVVEAHYAQF